MRGELHILAAAESSGLGLRDLRSALPVPHGPPDRAASWQKVERSERIACIRQRTSSRMLTYADVC